MYGELHGHWWTYVSAVNVMMSSQTFSDALPKLIHDLSPYNPANIRNPLKCNLYKLRTHEGVTD